MRRDLAALFVLGAFTSTACGGGGATTGGTGGTTPGIAVTSPAPGSSPTPSPAPGTSAGPGSSVTPAPTASAGSAATAAIPFPSATDADAFYAQPATSLASVPVGTILKSRSVTYEPQGVALPNDAWELQFVSRDENEQPIAAVVTVVKPLTARAGAPEAVVEAFAEDALGPQCAPSHDVTGGNSDADETGLPTAASAAGYTLIFPDFEGPSSKYAVGRLSGQITLDSIRAAEQFAPLGLNAKSLVAMNGYSGGTSAVAWAAALQPSYAPSLAIVGVASGGTVADVAGILNNIDTDQVANQLFFSIIFMATVGINRGFHQFLSPSLNAAGVAAATAMESGCGGKDSDGSSGPTGTFANFTTSNLLVAPGFQAGAAADDLPQPGEIPVTNMFIYHSQTDELIPIAGPDALVKSWCASGAHIGYYRAESGDHVTTELVNEQFVLAYFESVFGGTAPLYPPTTTTCN